MEFKCYQEKQPTYHNQNNANIESRRLFQLNSQVF